MVCITMTKNYLNNHTTKEVIATRTRVYCTSAFVVEDSSKYASSRDAIDVSVP